MKISILNGEKIPTPRTGSEELRNRIEKLKVSIQESIELGQKLEAEMIVAEALEKKKSLFKVIHEWEDGHNGDSNETIYYVYAVDENEVKSMRISKHNYVLSFSSCKIFKL
jgi:hypothetical protein